MAMVITILLFMACAGTAAAGAAYFNGYDKGFETAMKYLEEEVSANEIQSRA